jgi:site-specific DNA recombinase
MERQRIVRLVVKEILIGDDSIVIRHSIPIASTPPASGGPPAPSRPDAGQSYLLRSGSNTAALWAAGFWVLNPPVFHHARPEPLAR